MSKPVLSQLDDDNRRYVLAASNSEAEEVDRLVDLQGRIGQQDVLPDREERRDG